MKIFDWVHNRFNNKARNGADNGHFERNSNGLERWSGGILTIGTFGYDQLEINDVKEQDDMIMAFQEEEDEYISNDQSTDHHSGEEEEETENEEEEPNSFIYADHHGTMENNGLDLEYVMMKKKERITLADLFCADHHDSSSSEGLHRKQKQSTEIVQDKANNYCKKLDARPIHKLHQMVRRMLKRKIHPHHHHHHQQLTSTEVSMLTKYNTNDHCASLLPTQDGVE